MTNSITNIESSSGSSGSKDSRLQRLFKYTFEKMKYIVDYYHTEIINHTDDINNAEIEKFLKLISNLIYQNNNKNNNNKNNNNNNNNNENCEKQLINLFGPRLAIFYLIENNNLNFEGIDGESGVHQKDSFVTVCSKEKDNNIPRYFVTIYD
ncbi:hypothetical protein DDB_G0277617 [Dictyostelium discoideum AX4]|uniref:Uncharacterized protein n=1 Tax=Dictyostelium discoideum TaxID=44689 RepID=Q54ZF6_DICDI|nr:hypothetical protein DDB_G0277617 [Dictyostelium discoideum AX4]EAL68626.1 hypothetical protein DDB_G0277617 [Dictyostelium discoideum AX4]|eukprot:XP_642541.1 hypothetical protein DDB_G0277617 [Dictyostelium discoideum AX4]